jgi:NADH-quinone oxidoreductase subunit L
VGDLGFLITIFLLIAFAGTIQIQELNHFNSSLFDGLPTWVLPVTLLSLFWAATGKSAQFPLYVWLPDAMAGPTPVSALIHAATMVTSGIFVIVRLWPLFATSPDVLNVIFWVGILTAWLAALIALTQNDIKKVLAYSTVSQLGFMFAALGAGAPVAAFFHVLTHAFFKALLFLGSGSVIHGMHEVQDMREMGGLRKHMPHTHWTFLIGTLAIIGFPLTAGFFSKDLILFHILGRGTFAYVLMLTAALMTAFYMLRAYTMTFWGKARSEHASHAHESSPVMLIPLGVLALGSLVAGWLQTPHFLFHVEFLKNAIHSSWGGAVPVEHFHEPHMSTGAEILLVLFVVGVVLGVAYYSYKSYLGYTDRGFQSPAEKALGPASHGLIAISQKKFLVDEVYLLLLVRPLNSAAKFLWKFLDQIGINGILHGMRSTLGFTSGVLSWAHTGNVQTYTWYLAAGTALLMVLVGWVLL